MRAEAKIFLDGEFPEGAPAVRHVRDAAAGDIFGLAAVDPLPSKPDGAGRFDQAGDGAQGGGLAGAIGAEERRDAALFKFRKLRPCSTWVWP